MSERSLNLFERRPALLSKFGEGAAHVMGESARRQAQCGGGLSPWEQARHRRTLVPVYATLEEQTKVLRTGDAGHQFSSRQPLQNDRCARLTPFPSLGTQDPGSGIEPVCLSCTLKGLNP
jgi:hypothetical protein